MPAIRGSAGEVTGAASAGIEQRIAPCPFSNGSQGMPGGNAAAATFKKAARRARQGRTRNSWVALPRVPSAPTASPVTTVVPGCNPQPPLAEEAGWKDTVMVGPNQIVRVITRFEGYKGKYPYHCHILEHEDHEMMRQFQ